MTPSLWPPVDPSREALAALVADGLSDSRIGRRYSLVPSAVRQLREEYGIEVAVRRYVSCKRTLTPPKRVLTALVRQGFTDEQIAAEYGCSAKGVEAARWRCGLRRRPARYGPPPSFPELTAEFIRTRVAQNRSDAEIAREVGCSDSVVFKRRRAAGIGPINVKKRQQTVSEHCGVPRQIAEWPDLPPDAFKDVRTRHYGRRVSGGTAESLGLGQWQL